MNELVRRGEIRAPIVIGRDHLDTGSVASPFRETEGMLDGSDAIADWPLLNALVNTAAGASWVSIHNGGGVGIGYSQHAGMVVVADGTDSAKRRLERVLTSDPGMGVIRHADAGYSRAIEFAGEHNIKNSDESRRRGTDSKESLNDHAKTIECVPNFSEGRDLSHPADHRRDRIGGRRLAAQRRSRREHQPNSGNFCRQPGSGGGSGFPRNSKGGGTDRHAQTEGRASANGRDRCLSVHSGERRELGGGDRVCEVVRQARRRGAEDSRLSLREGGEGSGPLESLHHSRRRIRRLLREDQTAGLETGFRPGGVQREDQARP